MIEIIFKFNQQNYNIEYNEPKTLQQICEEFAKEHSLDINNIFLIHNSEEVNLNTEFYIEKQFDLLEIKTKTTLEFYVCVRKKFQIIFMSPGREIILEVNNLNEKIKDILEAFSQKARIDLTDIYFLYNEKTFDYENIGDKVFNDLQINKFDKEDKVITISYFSKRNDSIHSIPPDDEPEYPDENNIMNDTRETSNNLKESLINIKIDNKNSGENMDIKRGFYLKIFIILIIQYVFIISLSIIGFVYKFNEILIKSGISLEVKYHKA